MPAISKIRFTNVIYEGGNKRYNDEIFEFDGHNAAILLENGGGKTVFIQAAMQAIIPHMDMADRKIKDTLSLETAPAHVAIEWILNDKPRRYAVTVATLFIESNQLNSLKYTYDYAADDTNAIQHLPFSIAQGDHKRPASRGEMADYYSRMSKLHMNANVFSTIQDYGRHLENEYKIIPSEWRKVAVINSGEGNVDEFFNKCKTTEQLLNNLLIPVVEEAIEGDNSFTFVETFEKQRDHFKKNRILQDKIEQSQKVKNQIDGYIDIYENYEDERVALLEIKSEAKTVSNFLRHQIDHKNDELKFNEANHLILDKEHAIYEQKNLTYTVLTLEKEIKSQKEILSMELEQLDTAQKAYDQLASRKQNIELTTLNQDLKQAQDQLLIIEKELAEIDNDVQISDIKEQLDENDAYIKGYFTYELELIEREQGRLRDELDAANGELGKNQKSLESTRSFELGLVEQRGMFKSRIELLEEQKQEIIDDLDQVVENELSKEDVLKIEHKLNQFNKERLANESLRLEINEQIETFENNLELSKTRLESLNRELKSHQSKLELIGVEQEKLIISIESTGKNLYLNGSIYSREESIIGDLEEQREISYSRKEKALKEERTHFRLADMYENQKSYVVEPKLSEIVLALKRQTSYVELGSEYLNTAKNALGIESQILYDKYPYWALTIVTSAMDEEKVLQYVKKFQDELQFMVIVMTTEKLNRIIKSDAQVTLDSSFEMLYPRAWFENLDPDQYYQWQKNILEKAISFQEQRKKAESQLKMSEGILAEGQKFFEIYPYTDYINLKESVEEITMVIGNLENEIKDLSNILSESYNQKKNLEEESIKLSSSIEITKKELLLMEQILDLEELMVLAENDYNQTLSQMKELQQKYLILEKNIEKNKVLIEEIKESIHRFTREKDKIIDNELYGEVVNQQAIGTNIAFEVLKERRHQLLNKLSGMSRSRAALEERIEQEEQLKKRLVKDISQKTKEANYPIEEVSISFEGEISVLFDKMKVARSEIKELEQVKSEMNTSMTKLLTRCQLHDEELMNSYRGRFTFDVELIHIPNKLKIEKGTLRDRRLKLNREKDEIESTIKVFETSLTELHVKDGTYHYLNDAIEALVLDVSYFNDYDSEAGYKISLLLNRLEGQFKKAMKAYDKVKSSREALIMFCHEEINDHRLKDTVIKGIQHKDDYNDLINYQEKMTEIILKTIQVAEDDKRESDIELQTFLSHLLTYVRNVSTELDTIQSKTRIKVGDVYKQIFVFEIPEWEDEVAKTYLRNYIDETIEQYEKESLLPDAESHLLRKSIEERLSVKNLLQVVMQEHSIKIKCRKVTNDMQINKAPMIWESSNKWSGGEKWSKNMTLFLSILNYLAEKKQHLTPNQKRQRSVILDNPFGKASSDHVLKPVFMIAEKLGFQIIALTAHAEGKFISEYFPVVYSCRLRQTTDETKQVMTNERVLNYAYLKENAPMTVMRMQEVEQLNLFD